MADDLLPEPAPELVQDLKSGNVVGVVGSGLSCAAGFPGWVELIQAICDEAWGTKPGKRKDIAWAWQICDGQPLQAANLLKQDVLGPDFAGAVGRQLLRRRKFEVRPERLALAVKEQQPQEKPWKIIEDPTEVQPWPTASHRMLMQLGLRCVITTNYDELLEAAKPDIKAYSWSSADLPNLLAARKPLVLKIHGDLHHPRDLIAARVDYGGPYAISPTRKALESLLKSSRPLWIGYGHNDPDLDLFLEDMQRLGITGGYAIVPAVTPPLRRRLQDMDISVAELPEYTDVPRFLQRLALAAERPVAFTVRHSFTCPDAKAATRRGVALEDLLTSYGVQADVWSAQLASEDCQLEASPPDFRGLQALLRVGDAALLAKLAKLGVVSCDQVTMSSPPITPPLLPTPVTPVVTPVAIPATAPALPPTPMPAIPIYVPSGPAALALADLLPRLFSANELRAWVIQFAPRRQSDIDFQGPLRSVCLRVAEVLERHGLITAPMFVSLRDERPGRGIELDALSRHLFPPHTSNAGDSYTLFCRLLDRDAAWNTMTRLCDNKDAPLLFLLHGTPNQHISLFMDRVQRFLEDEARDGVRREHQVVEVVFERDHVRLQTAEEWEANFRRAMGFRKGRPLAEYLQRALALHAVMFIVRGRDTAPLIDLTPDERDGLREFLKVRLPAVLTALQAPHRAVRVLVGVEHPLGDPSEDELYNVVHTALFAPGVERKVLELIIPTNDEVEESVERFLSDRGQALTPELRARCRVVYRRHESLGDARNYRDLADDLYRELSPMLAAPRT